MIAKIKPIKVPSPEVDVFSEDSIMDVLQPQESGVSGISFTASDVDFWNMPEQNVSVGATAKACARCRKSAPQNAFLCPHCHSYLPPLQWQECT